LEIISKGTPFRLAWVAEYLLRSWGVRTTFKPPANFLIKDLAVE
jgi:hypothetical protein